MREMPGRIPRWIWLALPLAWFLYFYHLDAAGLLGPDEPRYAAIARQMAGSGDWVTPRLWGQPWFEKPALLYWMTAAGFRLGMRQLPAAAAVLGAAVLAKGLVPLALSAPLGVRRRFPDLLRPRVILPFLVVALPWYVLCYWKNGWHFLEVFIWEQHFGRLASASLGHAQPWWFYVPILAAGLLPWTPLAGLLARRGVWRDPRRAFLLAWLLFGLVFFSVFLNKLPGYVLPLVPAAAALMGIGLDEVADARWWLAACAAPLVAFPIAAQMLPGAVASGLTHTARPQFDWTWLLPAVVVAAVWLLHAHRLAATLLVAVCAVLGVVYLKQVTMPELDRVYSARGLWRKIEARTGHTCVTEIQRNWRYGLNYYSVTPLPDCAGMPKPVEIRQEAGKLPYVAARP
jgi:4-amino-4-deoxy-L-arabinose transferase-like glycosyltransferase